MRDPLLVCGVTRIFISVANTNRNALKTWSQVLINLGALLRERRPRLQDPDATEQAHLMIVTILQKCWSKLC